jgi:hypothetical protein
MGDADTRYFIDVQTETTIKWRRDQPFSITINRNDGDEVTVTRVQEYSNSGTNEYQVTLPGRLNCYEILLGPNNSAPLTRTVGMNSDAADVAGTTGNGTLVAPNKPHQWSIKHPWPTPGADPLGASGLEATARYFIAVPDDKPLTLRWSAKKPFALVIHRNDGSPGQPNRRREIFRTHTQNEEVRLEGSKLPYEVLIGEPRHGRVELTRRMVDAAQEIPDHVFGVTFSGKMLVQDPENPWPSAGHAQAKASP